MAIEVILSKPRQGTVGGIGKEQPVLLTDFLLGLYAAKPPLNRRFPLQAGGFLFSIVHLLDLNNRPSCTAARFHQRYRLLQQKV